MQAPRFNEVALRVVAWHNRHPLAQRIAATQVHSIGGVSLPFASALALTGPGQPAGLPAVADLLDPPQGVDLRTPDMAPGAFAAHLAASRASAAARQTAADPSAPAPSGSHDPTAPADTLQSSPAATGTDLDPFGQAEADLLPPLAESSPGTASPLAPDAVAAVALATAASRPKTWLARTLAKLTGQQAGRQRLRPLFSLRFIWPLSAGQVAGWVRRHGQGQPIAPTDWPYRAVQADAVMLSAARRQGLNQAGSLHLLTAAIGVQDRRIRLLMDGEGRILGPRAYSRARVAVAAGLTTAAVLGMSVGRLMPAPNAEAGAAVLAQAGASAPAGAASATPPDSLAGAMLAGAPIAASAASAGPSRVQRSDGDFASAPSAAAATAAASTSLASSQSQAGLNQAGAPKVPDHGAESDAGHGAGHPDPGHARPDLQHPPVGLPALAQAGQRPSATQPPAAGAEAGATRRPGPPAPAANHVDAAEQPTRSAAARRAGQANPVSGDPASATATTTPLNSIRPQLSADERLAAQQQAAALRPPPPPAAATAPATAAAAAATTAATAASATAAPEPTVFAVVSRPERLRETAAYNLTLMRSASVRLPPSRTAKGELMQNQGAWRAAWWPFATRAEAERARVMLSGQGLKTEVVEF